MLMSNYLQELIDTNVRHVAFSFETGKYTPLFNILEANEYSNNIKNLTYRIKIWVLKILILKSMKRKRNNIGSIRTGMLSLFRSANYTFSWYLKGLKEFVSYV